MPALRPIAGISGREESHEPSLFIAPDAGPAQPVEKAVAPRRPIAAESVIAAAKVGQTLPTEVGGGRSASICQNHILVVVQAGNTTK